MTDIAVVDYGMGNLRSVAKALVHVAPERAIVVSADPAVIRGAARVVLPGPERDARLHALPDASGLARGRSSRRPARARSSASASACRCCSTRARRARPPGLGMLAGEVVRFRGDGMTSPTGERLKVPHMGWSPVHQTRAHPLWAGIAGRLAVLFRAQLPSGAGGPGVDGGHDRVSVAVYLRDCTG